MWRFASSLSMVLLGASILTSAQEATAFSIVGSPTLVVYADSTPGSTFTEISTPTATPTASGVLLQGDLFWSPPPPPGPGGVVFGMTLETDFSIGPFPERVSPSLLENYKLVLSNGSATEPTISLDASLHVFLDSTEIDILSLVPPPVGVTGNGLIIVDDQLGSGPFILSPGTYRAMNAISVSMSDIATAILTPGITLEFGGLSGFSGFELSFDATPVPEPGTGLLLALGLGALGLCRRGARA